MCTRSVALVFLFIAINSSALNIEIKLKNDPQCKFKGNQCSSDLKQIIYCTAKNGDSYLVTSCLNNEKCKKTSDGKSECSGDMLPDFPVTKPKDTVFTCTGKGNYPDGYRCNTGYVCENTGAFPAKICECPPDTVITFHPSISCTINTSVFEFCRCPNRNECTGLSVQDFGNNCHSGYFYFCKQDGNGGFMPEVYKCPDGEIFQDGRCTQTLLSMEDQIPTETTNSTIMPDCKIYYPPCFPEADVKCKKTGELLPHKIDRCYYFCTGDLKPIVRDCGKQSIFVCINGKCGCVLKQKNYT